MKMAADRGCLLEEMQLGAILVRLGLFVMRAPGMYDLELILVPMLLIANGLERLCKVLLYLHSRVGSIEAQYEKWKSHDLVMLVHSVVDRCFDTSYRGTSNGAQDAEMLLSDEELNRILSVLADYAKSNRYFNLDYVAGKTKSSRGSEDKWGEQYELPRILAATALVDVPGPSTYIVPGSMFSTRYSAMATFCSSSEVPNTTPFAG